MIDEKPHGSRIAIALFDGVEELDWAGPWEVFAAWSQQHPDEAAVMTVADRSGPVTCAKGMRVLAQTTWSDVGQIDVIVVPGGIGTRPLMRDGAFHGRLRDLSADGTLVTSVCTGSLVLAAAGLLDGRPATTHHLALDLLSSTGSDIQVRAGDRFVDDGTVVTAAGVSAGIDMALHLVARLASTERAREVRRYIQYDPAPPV